MLANAIDSPGASHTYIHACMHTCMHAHTYIHADTHHTAVTYTSYIYIITGAGTCRRGGSSGGSRLGRGRDSGSFHDSGGGGNWSGKEYQHQGSFKLHGVGIGLF